MTTLISLGPPESSPPPFSCDAAQPISIELYDVVVERLCLTDDFDTFFQVENFSYYVTLPVSGVVRSLDKDDSLNDYVMIRHNTS